jgi:hypothetical protein
MECVWGREGEIKKRKGGGTSGLLAFLPSSVLRVWGGRGRGAVLCCAGVRAQS